MIAALSALLIVCVPPVPVSSWPGAVVRPFRAPACARCAGHRGITFAVPKDRPVTSFTRGTVHFDGLVARRRFLVVRTSAGDLVTYGDLAGARWQRGASVERGDVLGVSAGSVYVGVRRNGVAVDPRWVIGSPAARLVVPAALVCPVGPARASR